MSREVSPAAARRVRSRVQRQQASWAQRSGEVQVSRLLARVEGQCGGCLLRVGVGDEVALFVERDGSSWWGHAVCVSRTRQERPP